jgi:hypothetical protein
MVPKPKSKIWTNSKGKQSVVVAEDDFARISELIEDAGLSRILKEAERTDTSEAGIPFAEVKRQLAAHRRGELRRR